MRRRLDLEMVRRGLVSTRSEATVAIDAGKVTVGGRPAMKNGTLVDEGEPIVLSGPARRFVSRGGEKLDAAIDRFDIPVSGALALDAGASTGGFTDALLARGAAHVIAVDVGYGQLDWRLREDDRVTVLERTNVRDLDIANLSYRPDLVVADLSFISLDVAMPALARVAADRAEFVVLVKPQFEAGRAEVKRGGVVTDPTVWRRVLRERWDRLGHIDLVPVEVMASPLPGPAGNVEFLLHARKGSAAASPGADEGIDAAVAEGGTLRDMNRRNGAG
jgi:23S rRNA (cytidine1920-2'-O)/16S rRNA (cytidine1409-2'-O)-methyltransferase